MRKHSIELSMEQRQELAGLLTSGKTTARSLQHAQILLKSDDGPDGAKWTDAQLSQAYGVSPATIWRVRQRFLQEGLQAALDRRPQPERPEKRKIAGAQEAHLIALSCGPAPAGYQRWSVRLLADRFVVLDSEEKVGRETIRRTLKKTNSNRG